MTAQTFTVTNNTVVSTTIKRFVFVTPPTLSHSANLGNFGGSSSYTGDEFINNVTIAASASKSFSIDYANVASAPGTYAARVYIYYDDEGVLEFSSNITVSSPTALDYPTTINNVTTVTPIFAEFYNTLQNQVEGLLSDYGYSGVISHSIEPNELIVETDWADLVQDFQKTWVHQTNQVLDWDESVLVLTTSNVNLLIDAVNSSYANSSTVHPSQTNTAVATTSSRATSWSSTLLHSSTLTWATSVDMQRFFLLGGELSSDIGYTGSADFTWGALIPAANTRLQANSYGWAEFTNPSATLWAQQSGSGFVWSTDPTSMLDGNSLSQVVFLNVTRNTHTIDYHLGLLDSESTTHTFKPYHTLTMTYSVGDQAVNGYTGLAAPIPTTRTDIGFETGGTPPPPVIPSTRVLTASMTSSTFTFTQAMNSLYHVVSLDNSGNAPVNITAINYTSNGVTADPNYAGDMGGSAVHSVPPGITHTFALRYTAPTAGTYNNSFTILSNNNSGNVTVQTRQVVTSPAYYFTVSPDSISVTLTNTAYAAAQLTINEFNGTYFTGPGSYDTTPSLSGTNAASFVLDNNTLLGPTIAFDPVGKSNDLYSCQVNITINAKTVQVPITVILNVPIAETTNLGSWISPIQKNNGVIGISYDIIQDARYITIGVGTGADGSPQITNGTSKTGNHALVSNLRYDADPNQAAGQIVYASDTDSGSGSFFQTYGVWIRSGSVYSGLDRNGPRGREALRYYTFTAPTSADYTWTVSIDYSAVIVIDSTEIYTGGNNYGYSESGTVYLTAGTHTIIWNVSGDSRGPTGIAIQLKRTSDNQQIWSTRDAVRTSIAYTNWSEVYRFPILANGTASTYYSSQYLVKSWQLLDGYKYGDRFNGNNMFIVVDDGSGNVTITVNPDFNTALGSSDPTILYAKELFYYYSTRSWRVENIASAPEGDGTQTRWFRGFDLNGLVVTSLQNYPGSPTGSTGSNPVTEVGAGTQDGGAETIER